MISGEDRKVSPDLAYRGNLREHGKTTEADPPIPMCHDSQREDRGPIVSRPLRTIASHELLHGLLRQKTPYRGDNPERNPPLLRTPKHRAEAKNGHDQQKLLGRIAFESPPDMRQISGECSGHALWFEGKSLEAPPEGWGSKSRRLIPKCSSQGKWCSFLMPPLWRISVAVEVSKKEGFLSWLVRSLVCERWLACPGHVLQALSTVAFYMFCSERLLRVVFIFRLSLNACVFDRVKLIETDSNWLKLIETDWKWLKITRNRSKWIASRRESGEKPLTLQKIGFRDGCCFALSLERSCFEIDWSLVRMLTSERAFFSSGAWTCRCSKCPFG